MKRKLTLIGPLGADRRDALSQAFQSKYGITVEYHPDAGAGIFPRLNAERKAGLYLWDVLISGTSTALEALIPNKFLDPLEPTLILPEVKESKYWRGGALAEFLDPGHQTFIMTLMHRGTLYVNSNLVNPKEFTSHKDLLHFEMEGDNVADDQENPAPVKAPFCPFTAIHSWVRILSDSFSRHVLTFSRTIPRRWTCSAGPVSRGHWVDR